MRTAFHMLRYAARTLLVAALMVSIGLHWAVLQSAAWAGMIVSYSIQEGSLITGLSQTFDNEHPCPLCCVIKKGTQGGPKAPKKQEDAEKKLVLVFESFDRPMFTPPGPSRMRVEEVFTSLTQDLRPPTPPPRRGGFSVS